MPQTDTPDALTAAILARFPGAQIVDPETERARTLAELQASSMAVSPFSHAGPTCHAMGWTVFPQSRDGERKPGILRGSSIRPSDWYERPQVAREVAEMAGRDCARLNVAATMSARNRVFCLDLDIRDAELSERFATLAKQRFGKAFVRRYAQSEGKLGLIFSTDPAHDPVTTKRSYPILSAEGEPTGHVIEVLAGNSTYTLLGRHWKTGSVFQYDDLHPMRDRPTAAGTVTATQLQEFLEDASERLALIGKLKGFSGHGREVVFADGAVEGATIDVDGLVTPGGATQVREVTYNAEGKVTDGREAWIRSRAFAYCLRNPSLVAAGAGRHALAGALAREAADRFDGIGNHFATWHGGTGDTDVLSACRARVESAAAVVTRRPDFLERVGRDETGRVSLVTRVAVAAPKVAALAWLGDDALSTVNVGAITVTDQERKRRERAIIEDPAVRAAGQERVAQALRATLTAFVGQTRAFHRNRKGDLPPVTIAKAPTGAGKTSLAVELLSADVQRKGSCGPRLFLLPSYNNIDEVVSRARAGRAANPGTAATPEYLAMANAAANEARALGLKVEILTGKERGGCLMGEQLRFLRAQKQPASALCYLKERLFVPGAPEDAEPVYEETWCHHHPDRPILREGDVAGTCPVILARRKLAGADIVFAPTVFLTNALPEGLKDAVSGLIIDERCCFEMLKFAAMPIGTLEQGNRAAPSLTAKERAAGVEAEGWAIDRDWIAKIARDALLEGKDVAAVIANDEQMVGAVECAIRVCGRGQRSTGVKPNVTMAKLADLFQAPERTGIVQEHRFWSLVLDRVEAIRAGTATGDRDARIQLLHEGVVEDGKVVRLAWRDEPGLLGVPTLLLDASADADIIEKLWRTREVECVETPAYMHMRTMVCLDQAWSTTSLDVSRSRDEDHAVRISENVVDIRRVETAIAGIFGAGRVATFAPKRVRKSIRLAHAEPENVDSGHYGAVRGLDFAKDHMAIITVGRLEFPTWIYDALAAALTYDDPIPETPFDALGTGCDKDAKPLVPHQVERTLKLRDGRDLTYKVSEMPGRWGRAVQRQFREEEQRQCAGRLRPVYRDGEAPLWIAVSNVIPSDTIIDAVTTVEALSTLKGAAAIHEAVRRVGVLDRQLIAEQVPDVRLGLHAILGHGIGPKGQDDPAGRGLDAYAIRIEGEAAPREVLIPASAPDAISTAAEAYDRSGKRVLSVRLVQQGATPVPSTVRAPDAIDAEMGSRDARRAEEERVRALAREVVPPRTEKVVFQGPGLPPPRVIHDKVEVEAVLIAAGREPEEAREMVLSARDARAERAARRAAGQASRSQ